MRPCLLPFTVFSLLLNDFFAHILKGRKYDFICRKICLGIWHLAALNFQKMVWRIRHRQSLHPATVGDCWVFFFPILCVWNPFISCLNGWLDCWYYCLFGQKKGKKPFVQLPRDGNQVFGTFFFIKINSLAFSIGLFFASQWHNLKL